MYKSNKNNNNKKLIVKKYNKAIQTVRIRLLRRAKNRVTDLYDGMHFLMIIQITKQMLLNELVGFSLYPF